MSEPEAHEDQSLQDLYDLKCQEYEGLLADLRDRDRLIKRLKKQNKKLK